MNSAGQTRGLLGTTRLWGLTYFLSTHTEGRPSVRDTRPDPAAVAFTALTRLIQILAAAAVPVRFICARAGRGHEHLPMLNCDDVHSK